MLSFLMNQKEDRMQKTAWRLVRAAQDRLGTDRGEEKRNWCIERMEEHFQKEKRTVIEDHVRAAYMNFKLEHAIFERRI